MKAVVGVLVLLFSVYHGAKIDCDGRQNGAQCYGASGGTMDLQLMDNISGISKFQWFKKKLEILKWSAKNNFSDRFASKYLFTASNGTLTINKLNRTDDGQYTLLPFTSEGKHLKNRTLQLTVQDPVFSVQLLFECLSQGGMRVSCSLKKGDSPRYSWTLDGHTLTEAQLLSGNNKTNNITLRQNVSGQLVCSVINDISHLREEIMATCGSTTVSEGKETSITVSNKPSTNITSPNQTSTDAPWYQYLVIIAGVLSALVILIVGVACVRTHKKKHNNKGKEGRVEKELMYAEVRIIQQGRQTAPRADMEVEYSQVRFSDQLRQIAERTSDDTVYDMVRKDR